MCIRLWGAYPEGMSFAILVMNATVPLINRFVKPKRFGAKKVGRTMKAYTYEHGSRALRDHARRVGGVGYVVNMITVVPIAAPRLPRRWPP